MIKPLFTACFILLAGFSAAFAQCTGCIPNTLLCQGTSGPCPNYFDTSYAYNGYEDTLTFNLPATVDASQQSGGILGIVPFVEFRVANIQGLPFGINWTCSVPNCTYQPFANNGTFACIRFCGVPLVPPGNYNVTINTVGTIDGGNLGLQSGAQPFNLVFVVLADTSTGNAGFNYTSNGLCAPSTLTFTTNTPGNGYVPGPLNSGYTYTWDFGNGLQSNVESPSPVIYNNPGQYVVTHSVKIDTLPIALQTVNLTGANCTDFLNPADYYIKIFDASNTEVFNNETNQSTSLPFSIPVNLSITNPPYRIEVWDDDTAPIGGTADDNCHNNTESGPPAITLQLPPPNTFGQTTYAYTDPNTTLTFSYTYNKVVIEFNSSDTIEIFANPPAVAMGVSPALQVCNRDSIELSVYPGYIYEWYRDDTVMVYTGPNHFYYAKLPGSYEVKILDPNTGCYTWSNDTSVSFFPNLPPGYPNVGISVNTNGDLQSALSGNYTYQWIYFDGSNFIPIPPPTGTVGTYTPLINGQYALIATNQYGCTDTSNVINFQQLGDISASSGDEKMEIFPNPSAGKTWLRLENITGEVSAKLTDLLGQYVWARQLNLGAPAAFQQEIDWTALPKGIYVLEVKTEKALFSRKIILD